MVEKENSSATLDQKRFFIEKMLFNTFNGIKVRNNGINVRNNGINVKDSISILRKRGRPKKIEESEEEDLNSEENRRQILKDIETRTKQGGARSRKILLENLKKFKKDEEKIKEMKKKIEEEANEIEKKANEIEKKANEIEKKANEIEKKANEIEKKANEIQEENKTQKETLSIKKFKNSRKNFLRKIIEKENLLFDPRNKEKKINFNEILFPFEKRIKQKDNFPITNYILSDFLEKPEYVCDFRTKILEQLTKLDKILKKNKNKELDKILEKPNNEELEKCLLKKFDFFKSQRKQKSFKKFCKFVMREFDRITNNEMENKKRENKDFIEQLIKILLLNENKKIKKYIENLKFLLKVLFPEGVFLKFKKKFFSFNITIYGLDFFEKIISQKYSKEILEISEIFNICLKESVGKKFFCSSGMSKEELLEIKYFYQEELAKFFKKKIKELKSNFKYEKKKKNLLEKIKEKKKLLEEKKEKKTDLLTDEKKNLVDEILISSMDLSFLEIEKRQLENTCNFLKKKFIILQNFFSLENLNLVELELKESDLINFNFKLESSNNKLMKRIGEFVRENILLKIEKENKICFLKDFFECFFMFFVIFLSEKSKLPIEFIFNYIVKICFAETEEVLNSICKEFFQKCFKNT